MPYPNNDLEDTQKLLKILGSHWANTYKDRSLIEAYLHARGELELQNYQNLNEAADLLSRFDAPVYHTERWLRFVLKESDRRKRPIKYGDGTVYGPQPISGAIGTYGGSFVADEFLFTAPEGFVFSQLLQNQISEPSVSFFHGTDFIIDSDNGTVTFRTDPFADSNLDITEVFEGDSVADREITLWFKNAQVNRDYLYLHHGYVAEVQAKSSEQYKRFLNSYLDTFVLGSAASSIQELVAAMLGVPTAKTSGEIVEAIYSLPDGLIVATDKEAYRFHKDDSATVAVGDVLYKGQLLSEAVEVIELQTGQLPSNVYGIGLDEHYLTGYLNGVLFVNKTVPVVVEENVNGKTKVSFELSGHPADVEKFWEDTHNRGIAAGRTLAELMDLRGTPPPFEPNASTLPSTINPLEFLIKNVLRNNAFIVKVNVSYAMPDAFGFSKLGLLRKIVPPWTSLIFLTTAEISETPITLSSSGTVTAPGGSETLATFTGAEKISDSVTGTTRVSERVRLSVVEGFCR